MPRHLMGAGEIAKRLGLSRQRVQQLAERDDWPEPFDELAMGRVWLKADIEAWIFEQRTAPSAADPPDND
ncbi:helix-turn-helix transcriptional regulator [Actinoplanes sp. HUAS TT8]|uniref:helix-turn-helix transcriptional regulator n=1 Tax=Actinoplanes sp. HUAS TT8 TaxID=3447453 RepID=UPI003F51D444